MSAFCDQFIQQPDVLGLEQPLPEPLGLLDELEHQARNLRSQPGDRHAGAGVQRVGTIF